jgi:hypothetical protein
LLLSIVALAECPCEDSAISQKVKHKEMDGGLHGPTRENIFSKFYFFGTVNCYKLHKDRPGSFFAHKPLLRLDKYCAIVQKHLMICHKQARHITSTNIVIKVNLQTHSGAELMHCFLPAIMQGMTQDFGAAEVASPPPLAPSAAAETETEAWLGDPGRSYAL